MLNSSIRLMLLVVSAILLTTPLAETANALSLEQAKVQGLVGEKLNGYLGSVTTKQAPTQQVEALVESINKKRLEEYQSIAKRNGTTLETVETLAGRKALEKTSPGHYIMDRSGQWVKK